MESHRSQPQGEEHMRDTIDMAREAGFMLGEPWREALVKRFAELVRADEREACAKVCERMAGRPFWEAHQHYIDAAAAIRARGNT
jgi:hypothetical protein